MVLSQRGTCYMFCLIMIWSSRYYHATTSAGDSGTMTLVKDVIVSYLAQAFVRLSAPGGPTGRIRHS